MPTVELKSPAAVRKNLQDCLIMRESYSIGVFDA